MDAFRAFGLVSFVVGAVGPIDPGSVMLVIGAAVFAIATWKSRSPQILRQENADLRERNETLFREVTALKSEVQILHAQPNLEKMANVLEGMLRRLDEIAAAVVPK